MNNNEAISQNTSKLNSINILKGIGILMVILVHSAQKFELNKLIFMMTNYGQMGCQLLFFISAFTLCLSWNNKSEKNEAHYGPYIFKRFKTIAPGYYSMILIYFLVNTLLISIFKTESPIKTNRSIFSIIINVLFLNGLFYNANNNVVLGGWYIGTLAIFYIFFPLVFSIYKWAVKKNRILLYIVPLFFLFISVGIQFIVGHLKSYSLLVNNSFIYFSILNQFPVFLLGMLAFFLYKEDKLKQVRFPLIKSIIVFAIALFLFFSKIPLIFSIIPFISTISFYYLFIAFEYKIKIKQKFVEKVLISYGNLSYPIFLTHTFFVYAFPFFLMKILDILKISYNGTALYLILFIPIFIMVYYFAKLFNYYLKWLEKILFSRCKIS